MGTVITFYSYKGGVGRTMALANVASLLAMWNKKVLVVDWDLEAPGVEHFFVKKANELEQIQRRNGLIDLLTELSEHSSTSVSEDAWSSLVHPVRVPGVANPIHVLTAGSRSDGYFKNVRKLDVKSFYEDKNGGYRIESLRNGWKSKFDFVLVDSRTGITDIGGICTIQLPDILALVFSATDQSLVGAVDVAKKATLKRGELPFDRSQVPAFPIPSRFDTQTEQKIAREWLTKFESSLRDLYDQWLPISINRREFLELTKIPYAPYFSFGEGLPVVEQGTTDPTGLGFAYETVAALIGNNLRHTDILLSNRDEFVRLARTNAILPKTPLRDLPWDAVLLIDLVSSTTLRTTLERAGTSTKSQEALFNQYQSLVASEAEGGVLAFSDGDNFLFAFAEAESALCCALSIQESLAVKAPIPLHSVGHLRVRMAVHANPIDESGSQATGSLLQFASRIASKAQEGQILISGAARRRIKQELPNVTFTRREEQLELVSKLGKPESFEELFEVCQTVPVELTHGEYTALFKQDPESKSGGGFQAFLVTLQGKVNSETKRIELSLSDRERIARYAFDYRSGGWQSRLRKIFGRALGPNLGREQR